jgi:Putative DNA-binding domain
MDEASIRASLIAGEGQRLEFKETLGETHAAIETLSAFVHADGGVVVFGVSATNVIVGVSVGANTLENLANDVRMNTDPRLSPRIEPLVVNGKTLVTAEIQKGPADLVCYAYGSAFVRVGRTNQRMSSDEQRRRHRGPPDSSRHRPQFDVQLTGGSFRKEGFAPSFKVRQLGGDAVGEFDWRPRGPRLTRFDAD